MKVFSTKADISLSMKSFPGISCQTLTSWFLGSAMLIVSRVMEMECVHKIYNSHGLFSSNLRSVLLEVRASQDGAPKHCSATSLSRSVIVLISLKKLALYVTWGNETCSFVLFFACFSLESNPPYTTPDTTTRRQLTNCQLKYNIKSRTRKC